MIVKSEILVKKTSRSLTLEKDDTCSYTDRQITNICFNSGARKIINSVLES